jgi:hypothetical protein
VVGEESAVHEFEVSNVDDAAIFEITGVDLVGGEASDFRIVANDCVTGRILKPGSPCSIKIVFAPTGAGIRITLFGVGTEPNGRGGAVHLRGTGV